MGLLESSDEAQALAMHAKLVADRPQWAQEKAMQVLGAAFALGCSFPESWRQGNLQLSLPAGAETFSQASPDQTSLAAHLAGKVKLGTST